ncbi:PREDICTED: transcription factor bHLH80 [Nelumbo nucifera]|uniref:BHLH domain-containing protein n=2 Tax=Nelumbo nucifera TaxID=4432 RepID=A0A822Z310_NELNU|nr:PREDICTED: transcription factor bHLH80 [Nelumbo nucifera]DAD39080.1 TPA_asm: hypothetical protein HUJ06_013403 [Nelumbo nucifera]
MQQQHLMSGGGGGSGGGYETSRGLARFRSAPATWFENLLQDDEPLTQNQCLPQVPFSTSTTAPVGNSANFSSDEGDAAFFETSVANTGFGFLTRQNSSPAGFLGHLTSQPSIGCDGFMTNFDIPSSMDYLSLPDFPSNKRPRDLGSEQEAATHFSAELKGEQSVGLQSFSDMEMERVFSDSVPCRVRAKRGCATHPRSIAERVRRTRISDRIRKLQELVPNMDKQTNTADMLEEAVEYVKYLQKQIQELSEYQRNCKCTNKD